MDARLFVYAGIFIGISTLPAAADIYVWADGNGVKHFTNFAPPDKASIFMIEPKSVSKPAPVEQQSDSERLREAEDKIEDLNQEVAELKRQPDIQQPSKDTSAAPDGPDQAQDEGVTEYDPDSTSDRYDRSRYQGYSYTRNFIRYGIGGDWRWRYAGKHHYGYYYPQKYRFRFHKKHERHYKSHRYPKHRRHFTHRTISRRHGHSLKHHRSGRHTGFRMDYRHRR